MLWVVFKLLTLPLVQDVKLGRKVVLLAQKVLCTISSNVYVSLCVRKEERWLRQRGKK